MNNRINLSSIVPVAGVRYGELYVDIKPSTVECKNTNVFLKNLHNCDDLVFNSGLIRATVFTLS